MKVIRVFGILVLVLGVLSLLYGGFSYKTKGTALIDGFSLAANNNKWIAVVPIVIGMVGIVVGSSMFFERGKRK